MVLKIESVESKQLPRWVYAMMSANQDPNADPEIADNPAMKRLAKEKAENFYKKRQQRLKELSEQGTPQTSRLSGMEWKNRPKNKFSEAELNKIMPTRQLSYVIKKTMFVSIVAGAIVAFTGATVFCAAAGCAELKVTGNFHHAWSMFSASPVSYYHWVIATLNAEP